MLFYFQINAMMDILCTMNRHRDSVIALEEIVEGHSIVAVDNTIPLKVLQIMPSARKLRLETFQTSTLTLTTTIIGAIGRQMGELMRTMRG